MNIFKNKGVLYSAIFCLCLLIILVMVWHFNSRMPTPVYTVSRHIQYSFTLRNRSDRMSKNVIFYTYAPVRQTATQLCLHLQSSHPYQLISDASGNRLMRYTFDQIPPYGTKIVNIRADLRLSEDPNPLTLENPNKYVQPQKYCESDHPDIQVAAKTLQDPEPSRTAEHLFNWVARNVQHDGYLKNAKGALYALKNKKGDCTEFMYLFAALCRASNIPARCISGYICSKNMALKPASCHNWAEFYQDNKWWVADPQRNIFMRDPADYIAMRIIDHASDGAGPRFNRFRIEGAGMRARMN